MLLLDHIGRVYPLFRIETYTLPLYNVGGPVPRTFKPDLHVTDPNAFIQFDLIGIAMNKTYHKHIMMFRDYHGGYCSFYPSRSVNMKTESECLID